MNTSPHITLAIESAISGGSLSLLSSGNEIANWSGTSNVSKAEDLLANIDAMLKQCSIDRREIDLLAVSAGPGSFTGIRIGIATVLGLKTGLGIEMITVSLLEAMIVAGVPLEPDVTSAVPVGRDAVCLQNFRVDADLLTEQSQPTSISETEFLKGISEKTSRHFILHSLLYEKARALPNTQDGGTDLAKSIGIAGILNRHKSIVKPIFISKSF